MHNCISKFILFLDTFILEPLHSIFLPLQFEFVLLGLNQNLDVQLMWRPWHPDFSIKIVCFFEIGTKCLTEAPRYGWPFLSKHKPLTSQSSLFLLYLWLLAGKGERRWWPTRRREALPRLPCPLCVTVGRHPERGVELGGTVQLACGSFLGLKKCSLLS